MMPSLLDHITVTAHTLEAGSAFVHNALGVWPQPGGEHPRMGTHNRLLRLGPSLFLEVIAPNPAAPAPARPRWFALDTLSPEAGPSLSTWVVRTGNIHAAVAAASEPLGAIEPMSRGALNWHITLPADGSLPLEGAGPALIEWETESHPAAHLPDHGLSLVRLDIAHPHPERVARLSASLALDAPVKVLPAPPGSPARLVAHIQTPQGLRQLGQ
jgi:hypothetical protein